jgi:choline kinase
MKAMILAAGVGKRLMTVSQGCPKCLIEIGGRSLLDRTLQNLADLGIKQVTLVVGYKQEFIRAAFEGPPYGLDLDYLVNEHYERGSIGSLWIASQVMDSDTLIMDADVLFHPMILHRLVHSAHSTALAMDETVVQQGEECMVVAQQRRVVALTKRVTMSYDQTGEGVGFLKVNAIHLPQLKQVVGKCIARGELDSEYEDALHEFFAQVPVGYETIGGLPWTEIDFPEDVVRAEQEILPKLAMTYNGR